MSRGASEQKVRETPKRLPIARAFGLLRTTVKVKGQRSRSPGRLMLRQKVRYIFRTRPIIINHQSELVGDVAVPVSIRQVVLFCALRSPDARPRLNWGISTVLSQVCLGRPGRRLQFLGAGDMHVCRAQE